MRVIAGTARGHRLRSPKGRSLRPTADRVKEALFNILPHDLTGLKVLDLFAGTGNLSIEALSRGAESALLVDASRSAGKTIHENLKTLGFSKRSMVWMAPVLRSLKLLGRRGRRYDLIFVDPPYDRGLVGKVLESVSREGLLRERGVVVVEHGAREHVRESYGSLVLRTRRRYGDTFLALFGCPQHDPDEKS